MAGLLGDGWADPQSQMILGLAQGLLSARGGQGLAAGLGNMQGVQQNQMKNRLLEAQLKNFDSEIEARKLATVKDQRQQSLIESVFGNGGGGAVPGMSPGAYQPSIDGNGPVMPQPQQRSQGGLANMTPDTVARLKLGGLDLTDIYKFSQEPQKFEQGSTYRDRNTGTERFMPKVDAGIAPGAGGVYGALPGYGAAQASIEGQKAAAVERAKAGFDPITITPASGPPVMTTRGAAVQSMSGNPMSPRAGESDQAAIFGAELQKAQAQLSQASTPEEANRAQGDIAALNREIARLPGGVRQQVAGIPLQSDAEKAALVDTAKAGVVADTTTKKSVKMAGENVSNADRAIELLGLKPTASGFGAATDSAANFFGMATSGGEVAAKLDVVAAGLVKNVPRFEGPQSDKDVAQYKAAAGNVANRDLPISTRVAAAQEVRRLAVKAEGQPRESNAGGASGGWGDKPIPQAAINDLKMSPKKAAQFDQVFGAGAAARALGGK